MSRDKGVLPRCDGCGMHLGLCLCAVVQPVESITRVVVVMHSKEQRKSSNSGRLVPMALTRGEVRIRGLKDRPLSTDGLIDPDRFTALLYPTADAQVLDADAVRAINKPITLIVPDGNWRQAKKVALREPALRALPRVVLPPGPPSRYRLRSHEDPARVCTFEAVSRALGVIEGAELQAHLEQVFEVLVERTLWTRGQLAAQDVAGGIPEAAFRRGRD